VVQRVHPTDPAPRTGALATPGAGRPRGLRQPDPALSAIPPSVRRCGVEFRTRLPSCVVATRQSSTDPTTAVLRTAPGTVTTSPAVARTGERARPTRSTSCSRTSTTSQPSKAALDRHASRTRSHARFGARDRGGPSDEVPGGVGRGAATSQRAPQRDGSRPAAGARRTTPRARSCSQDGSPAPGDRPPPVAGASPASAPSTSRVARERQSPERRPARGRPAAAATRAPGRPPGPRVRRGPRVLWHRQEPRLSL